MRTTFLTMLVVMLIGAPLRAEEWLTLYDKKNKAIEARILSVTETTVLIERKDKKTFEIPLNRFSIKSESAILDWKEANKDAPVEGVGGDNPKKPLDIPADLPERLYPRSLIELEDGLAEIKARRFDAVVTTFLL